jgi:hypothetical protein
MQVNVAKEVAALPRMTVQELRAKHVEAFGEDTNTKNKAWLVKRIAWRLQALAEGGLSERGRQRAAELVNDADVRLRPPKDITAPAPAKHAATSLRIKGDHRLPPPGTIITRAYKGTTLRVMVIANGFEFEGERYKSLSALAKVITGQHCNGFRFFQLGKEDER